MLMVERNYYKLLKAVLVLMKKAVLHELFALVQMKEKDNRKEICYR